MDSSRHQHTGICLEDKKNTLLAALYDGDYTLFETCFNQVLMFARGQDAFSENDEKRLIQIRVLFEKFSSRIERQCSPSVIRAHAELKKILTDSARQAAGGVRTVEFQDWQDSLHLNRNQKDLLFKTVMAFQVTSGCSNFCRRCNEWALPGVRQRFSYRAAVRILTLVSGQGNDHVSLYGASDPLDWAGRGKDITDIVTECSRLGLGCSLLTKLPRGKKNLLKKLIARGADLSVSMTRKNKKKLLALEKEWQHPISKQHDTDDLLIPAGLDEDFISVKPSITDAYGCEITPDGAFIIIPTFTSALYPFGHAKLPVTRDTDFFPAKRTGRHALLVDYFKPLNGYTQDKEKITRETLLDVQVESVLLDNGSDALTPPGMRSLKEYFDIFEDPARHRRKQMTASIIQKIKDQSFGKSTGRKKINAHLDMCRRSGCRSFKRLALSFFLNAVVRYVKHHPKKLRIIRFLTENERKNILKNRPLLLDRPVADLFSMAEPDTFTVFRHVILQLVSHRPGIHGVQSFIKACPARFDPDIDLFVHK